MHDLHNEIQQKISISNDLYNSTSNVHKKLQEFKGEKVSIHVRPGRFPPGTVKKLHARHLGLFQASWKIWTNAYELDLLKDMGISLVFTVEDLTLYHEPINHPAVFPTS